MNVITWVAFRDELEKIAQATIPHLKPGQQAVTSGGYGITSGGQQGMTLAKGVKPPPGTDKPVKSVAGSGWGNFNTGGGGVKLDKGFTVNQPVAAAAASDTKTYNKPFPNVNLPPAKAETLKPTHSRVYPNIARPSATQQATTDAKAAAAKAEAARRAQEARNRQAKIDAVRAKGAKHTDAQKSEAVRQSSTARQPPA